MTLLPRAGESIARYTNRRKFLKKTATSLFSLTTGVAVSLGITTKAFAAYCQVGNTDSLFLLFPQSVVQSVLMPLEGSTW